MAIPMPIVQDIRRLDRQGMSRAQIARRLHVDRGTVAKYADMEDCSPKPKADRRYGSKIDPYAHLVDEWLEADRLLPRKQRHTIRRVHDRLLAETDYDGEYSTTMCISSSRCFVFSHVFFSGLGSCMHFPYFSGCAEVSLGRHWVALRRHWDGTACSASPTAL